jgi:hypothetical protein
VVNHITPAVAETPSSTIKNRRYYFMFFFRRNTSATHYADLINTSLSGRWSRLCLFPETAYQIHLDPVVIGKKKQDVKNFGLRHFELFWFIH